VAATNYPHGSDRLTNQSEGNRDATKNCTCVDTVANDERDSILGYGAVCYGIHLPKFRLNVLPPSSEIFYLEYGESKLL
jgi:hypothetical protein